MKLSLFLEDERVPRTVYYQRLREAIVASPRFVHDPAGADVLIPAEDTAMETLWPRFGDQASAYIRGRFSEAIVAEYVERVASGDRALCIVNMHPRVRLPGRLAAHAHVTVADVNLLAWERAVNPRTISMPALPITLGQPAEAPRTVLASFRGALSHPCRAALARLHDGRDIVCQLVSSRNHVRRVDATSGRFDRGYVDLLAASIFAFVPRGDAHFSYRLLEVMSFGCIPIVISDDWVLPFDRTIDWSACAVTVSEQAVPALPEILASFTPARVARMQRSVATAWREHLGGLDRIVETLAGELEQVIGDPGDKVGVEPPRRAEAERVAAFGRRVSAAGATAALGARRPSLALTALRELHDWLGRKVL